MFALGAIALWATLASLGIALAHVPPFLLTGLALVIGSVPAWPLLRQWRVPASTLALGVYGLFGYHFLLFVALRNAPPVEANLVNYLWPLLIVVLAPVLLPGMRLRPAHALAAVAGFAGAAIAILGAGRCRRWRLGLGLPARARLGVHLGELFAADAPRAGVSDRRHRPVRAGLGRAVAAVPCLAGACRHAAARATGC